MCLSLFLSFLMLTIERGTALQPHHTSINRKGEVVRLIPRLEEVLSVGSFKQYLDAIGSLPLYSQAQQALQFKALGVSRQDNDPKATKCIADDLILHNLRLVMYHAQRYGGNGVDTEDLVQVGNLGLFRAVDKFEVEKGFQFTTYASWHIRTSMVSEIARMGDPVKLPKDIFVLAPTVEKARFELMQRLGTESISNADISDFTGIPLEVLREMDQAKLAILFSSLDEPLPSNRRFDEFTLNDFLEDKEKPTTHEAALSNHASSETLQLLDELPKVVGEVIRRRTGIFDGREQTWSEIAEATGRSIDFVKSIYNDGLALLRDNFTADAHGRNTPLVTPYSDDEIGNLGLTRKQWTILSMLDSGKCPPTTREFAAQLGVDRKELIAELTRINDLYPLRA